jgi:ankyrin repeat protein
VVALGVNVEERDANGLMALHCAAEHGHVEVLRVLLELGADKQAKASRGGTALHAAAFNGHVEAIKALVQMGADKDASEECWWRDGA